MLGRGLQSLIPQSNQPEGQNPSGNVQVPQQPTNQPAPAQYQPVVPAQSQPVAVPDFEHELPASPLREELEMPVERKEDLLPATPIAQPLPPVSPVPVIEKPEPVLYPSPKPVAPKAFEEPKISGSVFNIEVAKVKSNPDQPRRHFDEEAIRDLASSIREFGILQPIVVTKVLKEVPTGTDVEYILIAGERRLLASRLLGLETIPAIIRNVDLERERLELAVIENIQRENLSPIEVARAIARLQDEFRLTQREIAMRLGKSRETVANTVRLLDLPKDMQEAVEKGQINESHGRLLLSIEDPAIQQKLFRDLLETRMTTRDLKMRIESAKRVEKKEEAPMGFSPQLKMFEEQLSAELGAPVAIHQSGASGKITISFYSGEELQNIMERLGKDQ